MAVKTEEPKDTITKAIQGLALLDRGAGLRAAIQRERKGQMRWED
jgi:hypothetical protein